MRAFFYILTLLSPALLLAQPDSLWSHIYGGANHDYCYTVRETVDGGNILGGYTQSIGAGQHDVYLVKTDVDGVLQWEHTYGGASSDASWQVRTIEGGGFILAGFSHSFGAAQRDGYLLRVDQNGDTLWTRLYGGAQWDDFYSVTPLRTGGFAAAGYTSSFGEGGFDFWLLKTNVDGDSLWSRTYGANGEGEYCTVVQELADGGFILGGWAGCDGPSCDEFWIIRTDQNGDSLWSRRPAPGQLYSLRETSDGGFIMIGTSGQPVGSVAWRIVKTDANGSTQWNRTYVGGGLDIGSVIEQTEDGGYVASGYITNTSGNRDILMLKLNADGDSLWSRTFGGPGDQSCSSIQQHSDGGFLLAGGTMPAGTFDYYLIRTEPEGPAPVLEAYPEIVDFGNRPAGIATNAYAVVINVGNGEVEVTSAFITGEPFALPGFEPIILWPADTLFIRIRFFSDEEGTFRDTLIVESTDPSGPLRIPVSATALQFHLTIDPDPIIFATAVGEVGVENLILINDGNLDITVGQFFFTAHENIYEVDSASITIPAGTQAEVEVTFTPLEVISYSTSLCMIHGIPPEFQACVEIIGDVLIGDAEIADDFVPTEFFLASAYPNPFNPATTISFGLPQPTKASLIVYDITGREITTLADKFFDAGHHSVAFDGAGLPSGVYLYRLFAKNFSATDKMVLIK